MNITLESLTPPTEWGEPFAHGSTASIYRARVRNSRSSVVVKRLNVPINNAASTIMSERISHLTNNRHANLVKYYGYCFSPLMSLIFMEYMPAGDLFTAIHSDHKKSFVAWEAQGRSIAKNIADGLAFLHSLDPPLVHFDLKSKNILLGSNLVAKIADLDSARAQPNLQLSVHSSTKKTLQWTAPELFRGKMVSKKVDVYSLSIVIWEILTQKIPWDGLIEFEVMGNIFNGLRPDIPPTTSSHIRLMLEKGWANNPDTRLTAQDVSDAMQVELDRYARQVLRESQDGSSSSLSAGEIGGRRRAPSNPVIHMRSPSLASISDNSSRSASPSISQPPRSNSPQLGQHRYDSPTTLRRSSQLRTQSPQTLSRTQSTDNFQNAVFTNVPLTPTTSPNTTPTRLRRTESQSAVGLRSRSDINYRPRNATAYVEHTRSESRSSESRTESRSEGRTEGLRTESDTSLSASRTDSAPESRNNSQNEHRNETPPSPPTSRASPGTLRALPASRMLKRSDSNPSVSNFLQKATFKRAESIQNLAGFLPNKTPEVRPESRTEITNNLRRFSFTRSPSSLGLKYNIANPPKEAEPRNELKQTQTIDAPLYNQDGYNTGEIHREAVDQFNANYLDDYIDNVNVHHKQSSPSPLAQSHLPTLRESAESRAETESNTNDNETDNTTDNEVAHNRSAREEHEGDHNSSSSNNTDDDSSNIADDDDEEAEEESQFERETEPLVGVNELNTSSASVSYEVNESYGDENSDNEEERQKKYMDVYSGPSTEDNNDNGSNSFVLIPELMVRNDDD